MADTYYDIRRSKRDNWAEHRPPRYPDRFEKSHTCRLLQTLPDDTKNISCAGRLVAFRKIGKLTFAHLKDHTGAIQILLHLNTLGAEEYEFLSKHLDVGDYIGVTGRTMTTKTGEKTILVETCCLLSKGLRPLPEKWHGLVDPELRARQRYLDLLVNDETRQRFHVRNALLNGIRTYLAAHDFFEVETPILQIASSGASARPFSTHHHALDMPLYLRIAPETYLKRLMAGGYERVFELGKCFRNEGVDGSHLQEFTMLEYYAAYWNYRDNMEFIQAMIQELVQQIAGSLTIEYQGIILNFSGDWPEVTYRDLLLEDTKIDLDTIDTADDLKRAIRANGLELDVDQYIGLGALIDALYKKYSRPHLIQPMFLTMHPSVLVPLARRSDANPKTLDMFQVLVNSWELVKAYSELVDPVEQYARLLEQRALAERGDAEAMMLEDDFIVCMEYGMPPMSGLGLGVDRLITLFTNSKNIRDVIYFPSLRPIVRADLDGPEQAESTNDNTTFSECP